MVLEFNGPLANAQMHYNCDLFEEAGAISGVCGEDLTWTLTDDGVLTISGTGEMKGFPYYEPWGEKVTTLVIEPGVTGIDELLFLGCNNLTTVTIPDSVTSIGEAAFWCCENLTDVRFGVGLMSIGVSAFGNCKRLADVYYAGTERGWAAVRIRIGNELLTEARMHYEWTPEELPPETPAPEPPALTLSDDAARAQASGGYEGLYARAALVLDNGGVSGLYVTQVAVDTDGTIVIPEFRVPGLTVKGVNVSLVPTLADIRSPTPKAEATATKMLSA